MPGDGVKFLINDIKDVAALDPACSCCASGGLLVLKCAVNR